MKCAIIVLSLVILTSITSAVQPFPGGVSIVWGKVSNDVSFSVWKLNPGSTNWIYLGNTLATNYLYTNAVEVGTMFGVNALQRSNGFCCVASEVGVAHWPPDITTPPKTVKLTPTNGFIVSTGQWVKVSSDLTNYSDWLRFMFAPSNQIRVEHMTSPLKPKLFMAYPETPVPPIP